MEDGLGREDGSMVGAVVEPDGHCRTEYWENGPGVNSSVRIYDLTRPSAPCTMPIIFRLPYQLCIGPVI